MSSGIGNHAYVPGTSRGPYSEPVAICPYCSYPGCEADYVDVGVGLIQCGPYFCPQCEASEASSLDTRVRTDEENRTGWYAPGTPVSEAANTCDGVLVNHVVAKTLYGLGLLDPKK